MLLRYLILLILCINYAQSKMGLWNTDTIFGSSGYKDGPLQYAQFNNPSCILEAPDTYVYVADTENSLIRRVDIANNLVTTIAGSTEGYFDGIGSVAKFNKPRGLAYRNGYLLVADTYNHLIRQINLSTTNYEVTTVAGTIVSGLGSPGTTDGALLSSKFNNPYALVHGRNDIIYVSDQGNHMIREINFLTNQVSRIAGLSSGSAGSVEGQLGYGSLNSPAQLAFVQGTDSNLDKLFIADTGNSKVRRLNLLNKSLSTLIGDTQGYGVRNNKYQFNRLMGLCYDSFNQFLYIADTRNYAIRMVDLKQNLNNESYLTLIAGSPPVSSSGVKGYVDAKSTSARFEFPSCVLLSQYGYLLLIDNGRIRKINLIDNNNVSTVAGQPYRYQNGPLEYVQFNEPTDIEYYNGSFYVSDLNHVIRKLDISTSIASTFAGSTVGFADGMLADAKFNCPYGIVYGNGYIYVLDTSNNSIRGIDLSNNSVISIVGGLSSPLNSPFGMVFVNPFLYISDTYNHLIRRIDLRTTAYNMITIAGGNGSAGYVNGKGVNARFSLPTGLVYVAPYLYVADKNNYTIRRIDLSTTNYDVTTIAGTNSYAYVDGKGVNARFKALFGLTYVNGFLYATDQDSYSVRQIDLRTTDYNVRTIAGNGTSGFVDGIETTARLNFPLNIKYFDGMFYLADSWNNHIRRIMPNYIGSSVTEVLTNLSDYLDFPLTLGGGIIQVIAALSIPNDINLRANSTIDTQGFNVTLTGKINLGSYTLTIINYGDVDYSSATIIGDPSTQIIIAPPPYTVGVSGTLDPTKATRTTNILRFLKAGSIDNHLTLSGDSYIDTQGLDVEIAGDILMSSYKLYFYSSNSLKGGSVTVRGDIRSSAGMQQIFSSNGCEFVMDGDFDTNYGGTIEAIEDQDEIKINPDSMFHLKSVRTATKAPRKVVLTEGATLKVSQNMMLFELDFE